MNIKPLAPFQSRLLVHNEEVFQVQVEEVGGNGKVTSSESSVPKVKDWTFEESNLVTRIVCHLIRERCLQGALRTAEVIIYPIVRPSLVLGRAVLKRNNVELKVHPYRFIFLVQFVPKVNRGFLTSPQFGLHKDIEGKLDYLSFDQRLLSKNDDQTSANDSQAISPSLNHDGFDINNENINDNENGNDVNEIVDNLDLDVDVDLDLDVQKRNENESEPLNVNDACTQTPTRTPYSTPKHTPRRKHKMYDSLSLDESQSLINLKLKSLGVSKSISKGKGKEPENDRASEFDSVSTSTMTEDAAVFSNSISTATDEDAMANRTRTFPRRRKLARKLKSARPEKLNYKKMFADIFRPLTQMFPDVS